MSTAPTYAYECGQFLVAHAHRLDQRRVTLAQLQCLLGLADQHHRQNHQRPLFVDGIIVSQPGSLQPYTVTIGSLYCAPVIRHRENFKAPINPHDFAPDNQLRRPISELVRSTLVTTWRLYHTHTLSQLRSTIATTGLRTRLGQN